MTSCASPYDFRGPAAEEEAKGQASRRVISSAELFGGAVEVTISHDNALYRLRITRQGKLVLNK